MKAINILISLSILVACSNPSNYQAAIEIAHVQKQGAFFNPKETPLDSVELASFKGIFFFPVNESYKVKAVFHKMEMPAFDMPHTLERTYKYQQAGDVSFELNGKKYTLPVYTNEELKQQHQLFFPFTDLTNGKETYHGGRFLDLQDTGNEIVIDFNLAYFPYCAYSHRFSCPIVPKENHLDTEVKAGEKFSN
jgi:uncharacterized protein (DUF1684 family)